MHRNGYHLKKTSGHARSSRPVQSSRKSHETDDTAPRTSSLAGLHAQDNLESDGRYTKPEGMADHAMDNSSPILEPPDATLLESSDRSNLVRDDGIFDVELSDSGDLGFKQYCASCDQELVSTHSSKLYCSAACRRHDAVLRSTLPVPSLFTGYQQPKAELHTRAFSYNPPSDPHVSTTLHVHASKPPKHHTGKSDIDPTEWKPAEISGSKQHDIDGRNNRSLVARATQDLSLDRDLSEAYSTQSRSHVPESSYNRSFGIGRTIPSLSLASTVSLRSFSSANLPESTYRYVDKPIGPMGLSEASYGPAIVEHSSTDDMSRCGSRGKYVKQNIRTNRSNAVGSLKKLLSGDTYQ